MDEATSALDTLKQDHCQNMMGDGFQLQSLLLDTTATENEISTKHQDQICNILLPNVNDSLGQNCDGLASIIPQQIPQQIQESLAILQQQIQLPIIPNQTAVNIAPHICITEPPLSVVNNDAKILHDFADFVAKQVEQEQNSSKNLLREVEKLQNRLIEENKFEEEILSTENLKSLIPHVVEDPSTYLKDYKENKNTREDEVPFVFEVEKNESDDRIKENDDDRMTEENVINELQLPSTGCEVKMSVDEMKAFAKKFKQQRVRFGFTQTDVGLSLGNMLGNLFSQTTVCRFEAIQLSHKSMCKLYPLFSKWIAEVECNLNGSSSSLVGTVNKDIHTLPPSCKKRRKRTSLDAELKSTLEALFAANQKPNGSQLDEIGKQLNIEKDVVRVWFCNRRQREKKYYALMHEKNGSGIPMLKQSLTFVQTHQPSLFQEQEQSQQ